MSDATKVDRRDRFMADVKRPSSSEPDLVITIRDEPRRGRRWVPRFGVILSSGRVKKRV
jgi:hypothetical protein